MEPRRLRLQAMVTAVALSVVFCVTAAFGSSVTQPPSSVGAATNTALSSAAANAAFVDQSGTPERLAALKGETVFVVPYLTLCGDTCPFTTGNLLQLQELITKDKLKDVQIVALDVDPYRDTLRRVKAYAKLIGANFELWTEQGVTTRPSLPKGANVASGMNGTVGKGDINANLTAVEKFFGWTVRVVPQSSPPPDDWMAPHEKLTYDINHSDGFWVIDPSQDVRFVSGTQPAFTGRLSKVLATFMGYKSNIYQTAVYKKGWTPAEALQSIEWVQGTDK
jgi:cytochrome oxidase Cu insertion factor (SCO1/SenC/PrrC family)